MGRKDRNRYRNTIYFNIHKAKNPDECFCYEDETGHLDLEKTDLFEIDWDNPLDDNCEIFRCNVCGHTKKISFPVAAAPDSEQIYSRDKIFEFNQLSNYKYACFGQDNSHWDKETEYALFDAYHNFIGDGKFIKTKETKFYTAGDQYGEIKEPDPVTVPIFKLNIGGFICPSIAIPKNIF